MILQFILQILLPAVFLGVLGRSHFKSKLDWLLSVLVLGSILLFSFVTARWDWYIELWPEQRRQMLALSANALAPGGVLCS